MQRRLDFEANVLKKNLLISKEIQVTRMSLNQRYFMIEKQTFCAAYVFHPSPFPSIQLKQ